MGLREEKKERTRQDLFTTAICMFRRDGYDETKVRDVFEAVGVSEATFFNYFPTKESLLRVFVEEAKESYAALLRHQLANGERPVVDRVVELMRVVGQSFSSDRDFMEVVVGRTNIFFGSTGDAKQKDDENLTLLAELFRQGQDKGEIRTELDPFQLAEVLTGTYLLTIANWVTRQWDDPGELDQRLVRAVQIVLEGCRVPSSHRSR